MRAVRAGKHVGVVYGFGDASGAGFGSSFSKDGKIIYQHGVWADHVTEESSNYRELRNLVESIRADCIKGKLSEKPFRHLLESSGWQQRKIGFTDVIKETQAGF